MTKLNLCGVCVLLSVAAGTVGCATARMTPPADVVGSAEVLTVSDRSRMSGALVNEGFKLGKYEVKDVDRDWNSKSGVSVGPWAKSKSTSGFAYSLEGHGPKLSGKCSSQMNMQGIGGFNWGSLMLACSCEGDGTKAELLMSEEGRSLKVEGKDYKLQSIHAIQSGGTQTQPSGYRADGSEMLGAVEVLHPGQIWLRKGLDEATQRKAACLFVGLMLYRPPS